MGKLGEAFFSRGNAGILPVTGRPESHERAGDPAVPWNVVVWDSAYNLNSLQKH